MTRLFLLLATVLSLSLLGPGKGGAVPINPGDLIVADFFAGAIFQVDRLTGTQTIISSGGSLHGPIGVRFEASGGVRSSGSIPLRVLRPSYHQARATLALRSTRMERYS